VYGVEHVDENRRAEWLEKKYRSIMKGLKDFIIECDSSGRILDVYGNCRATGYDEHELVGRRLDILFGGQPLLGQFVQFVKSANQGERIFSAKIQRKRQPALFVAVSFRRIPANTAKPIFSLVIRDITERLKLVQQNRQMTIKVRQSENLAHVGSLVQGLTHNLQGPLTAILGRAQMLSLKYAGERELNEIMHAARTMAENIKSLLFKFRGEQQFTEQDLDLNEVLRSELRLLEADPFFKHQVGKEFRWAENLPRIKAVYGDFSQILANVLRNALDAMRESPDKKLTISTEQSDDRIIVTIADTGTGIDSKDLDKIFDPHFTTKPLGGEGIDDNISGLGLGLASVKELLAPYKPVFNVTSSTGGTVFQLLIPCQRLEDIDEHELIERVYSRMGSVIEDTIHLPTIPNILYEVLDATHSDMSLSCLAPLVENDYSLAEKIFSIVNSAYYSLVRPISDLSQAFGYLGLEEVRDICFSLLSQQIMLSQKSRRYIQRLWGHSLTTAIVTKQMITHLGRPVEYSYLTALLHDVGQIILLANSEVLTVTAAQPEPEDLMNRIDEYDRFRITHDAVGSWFLREKTRLPDAMRQAIEDHHKYPSPESPELTKLIALADRLAWDLDRTGLPSQESIDLGTSLWGFDREEMESITAESLESVNRIKDYYRINS